MRMFYYQFLEDNGRITFVCASCRKEAVKEFQKEKGVTEDYVKIRCVVRNMGGINSGS